MPAEVARIVRANKREKLMVEGLMESARATHGHGERRMPSGKGVRRYTRFKASLKGCLEYSGSSYLCLVEDMNERGFQLLSIASPKVGDQMRFTLHVTQDTQLSCLIEVRHVADDGFLGVRIVAIDSADASALRYLIDERSKCAA
ncbi:MAG: PilZ domain-containing protein [Betaproteobacteria bacterium]